MLRSRRLYMLSICESLFLLFCIEIIFSFYLDGSLLILVLRGATYYRLRNVAVRAKLRAYMYGVSYAEAMNSAATNALPMSPTHGADSPATRSVVAALRHISSRTRDATTATTNNAYSSSSNADVARVETRAHTEPAAGAQRQHDSSTYTNQTAAGVNRFINLMMDGNHIHTNSSPRTNNNANMGSGTNDAFRGDVSGVHGTSRAYLSTAADNPANPHALEVTDLFNDGRMKHFRMCAMRYALTVVFHLLVLQSHYWNAKPPRQAATDARIFGQEVGFWRNYLRGVRFVNFTAAWGPLAPLPCVIAVMDLALALLEYLLWVAIGIAGEKVCEVVPSPSFSRSGSTTTAVVDDNLSAMPRWSERPRDGKELEEAMTTIRPRDRCADHTHAPSQPYQPLSLYRDGQSHTVERVPSASTPDRPGRAHRFHGSAHVHTHATHRYPFVAHAMQEGRERVAGWDVCAVEVGSEVGISNSHYSNTRGRALLDSTTAAGHSAAATTMAATTTSSSSPSLPATLHQSPRAAAVWQARSVNSMRHVEAAVHSDDRCGAEHATGGDETGGGRALSSSAADGHDHNDGNSSSSSRSSMQAGREGDVRHGAYVSVPGRMHAGVGGEARREMHWRDYVHAVYTALFVGWQAKMLVLRPDADDYADTHHADSSLDSVTLRRMMQESGDA